MKLIIIIPAYNEEKTIASVIRGIPLNISGISDKKIVVIDDGSTDNTRGLAEKAGAEVVSHSENKGLGVAFSTGIKEALLRKADVMVTLDADGQFDSQEIPKVSEDILRRGADVVLGSRFMEGYQNVDVPPIRLIGNRLMAKFISWICGKHFSDVSCGFRAYSKEALLHLNLFGNFTYTQEVILNLNFKNLKVVEVPIGVKYFPKRASFVSGNLLKYISQAMKIIFRTVLDYKPLKVFGGIGATFFILGLLLDLMIFSVFLETGQFTPYKFIGILGLLLNTAGVLLIIIGLIADMLNRTRLTQERILYYQKEKLYYGD